MYIYTYTFTYTYYMTYQSKNSFVMMLSNKSQSKHIGFLKLLKAEQTIITSSNSFNNVIGNSVAKIRNVFRWNSVVDQMFRTFSINIETFIIHYK